MADLVRSPVRSAIGPAPVWTFSAERDARAPAVLLFHGLRSSSAALHDEARAIARAGMTAVLVDAPHHGARRSPVLDAMPDTGTREGYATLLRILREAKDEVPSLVDHLLGLGHARVAIAGVSMGAYVALAGAVLEPRISPIVSLLGSPDWTPHEGEAATAADVRADADDASPCRHPEAFVPRPLLMLNGARDVNVRPEGARAFAEALRPLYAARGASDVLVHRELDVDHFAPPEVWREMVETAVVFLSRALLG
ncbi:MAG: alpha/beta fold hydrolase [Polyangiaceae bacterium]